MMTNENLRFTGPGPRLLEGAGPVFEGPSGILFGWAFREEPSSVERVAGVETRETGPYLALAVEEELPEPPPAALGFRKLALKDLPLVRFSPRYLPAAA